MRWLPIPANLPPVDKEVWVVYDGIVQFVAYKRVNRGPRWWEWKAAIDIDGEPYAPTDEFSHYCNIPKGPSKNDLG